MIVTDYSIDVTGFPIDFLPVLRTSRKALQSVFCSAGTLWSALENGNLKPCNKWWKDLGVDEVWLFSVALLPVV